MGQGGCFHHHPQSNNTCDRAQATTWPAKHDGLRDGHAIQALVPTLCELQAAVRTHHACPWRC